MKAVIKSSIPGCTLLKSLTDSSTEIYRRWSYLCLFQVLVYDGDFFSMKLSGHWSGGNVLYESSDLTHGGCWGTFVLRKAIQAFSYIIFTPEGTRPLDSCGANLSQVFPSTAAERSEVRAIGFEIYPHPG